MKIVIGLIVWTFLFLGVSKVVGASPDVCSNPDTWVIPCKGLYVSNDYGMQPFGMSAEDDLRAMDVIQPTYHPMVTTHMLIVQPVGLNK